MKIKCSKSHPPLGGLIVAEYVKTLVKTSLDVSWGDQTAVENIECQTSNDVARAVANLFCQQLYGATPLEMTEVDHWLTFTLGPLKSKTDFSYGIDTLNRTLGPVTYLVGKNITIADFIVFSSLYVNKEWQDLLLKKTAPVNVLRWYNFIKSIEAVNNSLNSLSPELKSALVSSDKRSRQSLDKSSANTRAQEGKFVDLPGAEMGKVVVRFPPEASGLWAS